MSHRYRDGEAPRAKSGADGGEALALNRVRNHPTSPRCKNFVSRLLGSIRLLPSPSFGLPFVLASHMHSTTRNQRTATQETFPQQQVP